MQYDKNSNETKMTHDELLREIEKQKAIIAAKERGASIEEIEKLENEPIGADISDAKAENNDSTGQECAEEKTTILHKIGKIAYIISLLFLSLILLVNVYMIFANRVFKKSNPTVFGIGYAVVLTDSMDGDEPDSFAGNSLIFTVKKKSYEVGDVITFSSDDMASVTHRIIAIEDGKFVTKGDANNKEDDYRVEMDDVVGKVFWTIKGAGGFIRALTTPIGLLILSCLVLAPFGVPYILGYYDEEEE